jgi:hypothetical protein
MVKTQTNTLCVRLHLPRGRAIEQVLAEFSSVTTMLNKIWAVWFNDVSVSQPLIFLLNLLLNPQKQQNQRTELKMNCPFVSVHWVAKRVGAEVLNH